MATTKLQPVSATADDARALYWELHRLRVPLDAAAE